MILSTMQHIGYFGKLKLRTLILQQFIINKK